MEWLDRIIIRAFSALFMLKLIILFYLWGVFKIFFLLSKSYTQHNVRISNKFLYIFFFSYTFFIHHPFCHATLNVCTTQLHIEFRPESFDGIILLTGERDDLTGDFMAVLIHQGFIEFWYVTIILKIYILYILYHRHP